MRYNHIMRFVAYTIKGLENVVESELHEVLGAINVIKRDDKVLLFDYEGSLELLESLRTVDDIGVFVSYLDPLDALKVNNAIGLIKTVRNVTNIFSITTSIVSVDTNKENLVKDIIEKLSFTGLNYTTENRSNLDFRIFLNPNLGFLAIRFASNPLNKRNYEIGNYIGALKPSIAAAMVRVATASLQKDARIVDNFCGSGTILCEAYDKGFQVYGGDINTEAVSLTKQRLNYLGYEIKENIKLQDATKTKWNPKYFDCAISNLPWDKQHEVSHITELYIGCIKEYKRILKNNFRLCIICHKPDLLIKHIKKEFGNVSIKRTDIGYLGQTPSIILATNI